MPTRKITLVRPSDVFRAFEDSMSSIISDISTPTSGMMSVDVNVRELADRYEVKAQVPGFNKEDIEISFDDTMLIIEGKTSEEVSKEEGNYVMQEYREGSFRRVVTLPSKVDTDKAEAELKNGVLRINIPKLPEILPKKVNIKVS